MNEELTKIEGAAKIGRNGQKLHPAVKFSDGMVLFQCSCPGTQNGSARGTQFFAGMASTCGAG